MKRILIDGRFIGVGESISRYVLETLRGILELDKENDYTLLIRPIGIKKAMEFLSKSQILNLKSQINTNNQLLNTNYQNLHLQILDIPHYSFAEQTTLLSYLNKEKFDLVHFTQFNHPILYKGKFVVTIHDLTQLNRDGGTNKIKLEAYKSVVRSAVTDSQKIITVSNTTRDDVINKFKVKKGKFETIYLGIDHQSYNTRIKNQESRIKNFKEKYGIADDYILYTGMWKKHKNLMRLLQGFEKYIVDSRESVENKSNYTLPTANYQLVFTGKIDKKEPDVIAEMERINKNLSVNCQLHTTNYIVTTGFIDEEELPIAYAGAKLYVIPSLMEGFGWPPLEAMACGTPVIASKISCIPEILGDAPHYFDPYSIDDIARAMKMVITDPKLQTELSQKGLKQALKYDWTDTVKKTLDVYKSITK